MSKFRRFVGIGDSGRDRNSALRQETGHSGSISPDEEQGKHAAGPNGSERKLRQEKFRA